VLNKAKRRKRLPHKRQFIKSTDSLGKVSLGSEGERIARAANAFATSAWETIEEELNHPSRHQVAHPTDKGKAPMHLSPYADSAYASGSGVSNPPSPAVQNKTVLRDVFLRHKQNKRLAVRHTIVVSPESKAQVARVVKTPRPMRAVTFHEHSMQSSNDSAKQAARKWLAWAAKDNDEQ
jgi:hypothetical protein